MADDERKAGKHPGCNCTKAQESDYCSAYCEAAAETNETSCGCGHPGCS
ncbi:MAG: hypothetical protein WKF30_00265 [Pyrinomonadaceae bacterium]